MKIPKYGIKILYSILTWLLSFEIVTMPYGNAKKLNKALPDLRIAMLQLVGFTEIDENKTKLVGGEDYKILEIISKKLNFRYRMATPIAAFYGSKDANGTWNGVVGRLKAQKADMGLPALYITYDRYQVIDFTIPYYFAPIDFIVRAPHPMKSWTTLLRPFTIEVWAGLVTSIALSGYIIYYIMKTEFRLYNRDTPWSISTVYWVLFSSFTLQGSELKSIRQIASRLIIAIWSLSVLVVACSYSGILTAFMTSPIYEEVPRTFQELAIAVQKGKYFCGITKHSALESMFMSATNGMAKVLGDHMRKYPQYTIPHEPTSVKLVLKNKFAYISSRDMYGIPMEKEGKENFIVSTDTFTTFGLAYGFRKHHPYYRHFNKILKTMKECGIIAKIQKDTFDISDEHLLKGAEFNPLKVEDILSPLLLLCLGYILSIICLALEITFDKMMKARSLDKR